MESGRSVLLPVAAGGYEDSYGTISTSFYPQAVQYCPYNPYNCHVYIYHHVYCNPHSPLLACNACCWPHEYSEVNEESDSEVALNAYFNLAAELFHSPRNLGVMDPNEIIDHMCAADMSSEDLLWLLDLELGHPKKSQEKSFATFNFQSKLITRSDSPTSMHPGFAQCSEELRNILVSYYDSIITSWYLGFVTYYGDFSVFHFQEWLTRIMAAYGMSWP